MDGQTEKKSDECQQAYIYYLKLIKAKGVDITLIKDELAGLAAKMFVMGRDQALHDALKVIDDTGREWGVK